jgi:ATP-dependent protease ClpP protease subunit
MKIFIYGTIGSSLFSTGVSASEVIAQLDEDEADPVALYVNSGGGDVFEGIAIHNALKRHQGRVTVYIDGLAASAASVIAMAGDEIVMPENTMMMVHNPWTMAIGGADDLRKTADILDQTRDAIVTAYRDKTGMDEDELRTLLDDETWLSAKDAVAFGFADRLEAPLEEEEAVAAFASIDLSQLKKVPQAIMSMAQRATTKAANAAAHEGDSMTEKQQKAASPAPTIDLDAVKAEAMKAERERSRAILAEATRVGLRRDTIDSIVEQGLTVEASRALIIDAIAVQQSETRPVISGVVGVSGGKDSGEKWSEGVTQALCARAGLEKTDMKNPFRGMTLMELGKEDLRRKGVEASGNRLDIAAQIFAHAGAANHNTGDFPNILKDVAHKAMLMGWEEAEETFDRWTRAGSLPDFKENSRVGINGFPSLREVGEGAEYKYVTFGDTGETLKLKTFGELFAITRQALINDDLSAMTRLPQNMGRAARATIGDAVYDILKANTQVIAESGQVLFHSGSHGNTGTNILSETGLTLAATAMRKQKSPGTEGRTLNLRPAFLIVPAALEFKARQLMASSVKIGGTNNEPNVVANLAEVIVDARLDATQTVGATQYFLAANPGVIDTIEVGYLDGVQAPFLDQQDGWGVDGTEFKVRIDFVARALGYRGLYRQTGASGS